MTMQRWDPFREMERWRDEMDRMLGEFGSRAQLPGLRGQMRLLPLDVYETPEHVIVKASVAGIRPEDIEITVTGNTLTVRGERKEEVEAKEGQAILRERWFGSFRRDITLPTTVQADRAEATFENGELTLRLPKSSEARPKRITVKTGQQR